MARMTKAQRRVLESSMYDLERFLDWIRKPNVSIVVDHGLSTGPSAICKEAGSELQFVENAADRIKRLHAEQFS